MRIRLQGYASAVMVPHGVQLVDGADNARQAVREQISHGADWIKVYNDRSYRVREGRSAGRYSDLYDGRTAGDCG